MAPSTNDMNGCTSDGPSEGQQVAPSAIPTENQAIIDSAVRYVAASTFLHKRLQLTLLADPEMMRLAPDMHALAAAEVGAALLHDKLDVAGIAESFARSDRQIAVAEASDDIKE